MDQILEYYLEDLQLQRFKIFKNPYGHPQSCPVHGTSIIFYAVLNREICESYIGEDVEVAVTYFKVSLL
jgi:hypothetical protein